MRIEAHDRETGERFSGEAPGVDEPLTSDFFNSFDVSDRDLQRWINRLPLKADAKRILHAIAKKTIMAGDIVIRIGRKILEIALFLTRKCPMATTGLVIGALIGVLAGSIPIIGLVLGPIIMPLAMSVGLTVGAFQDIRDAALRSAVQESIAEFDKLKTV